MYLNETDVKKIFDIINNTFNTATVLVETMSPFIVKHITEKSIEKSKAKFTWGVKNGRELQNIILHFTNIKDVSLTEGMKEFMPIYKILGKFSFVRNISNKIVVMKKN